MELDEPAHTPTVGGSQEGRTSYRSYRESTHLIPSPGADGRLPKRFDDWMLSWPVVLGAPLLLLLLGIALEVALAIMYRRGGGFPVPLNNALSIVSPQFLVSFAPTIVVIPVALLWRGIDWNVRWFQPYIVLWKGGARAEESLLLDYVALGPFFSLFRAKLYKHRILFWSSLSAVVTFSFQPLAGSIFQLRQKTMTQFSSVSSTKEIGLVANVDQLNAFVASSGFTDAAVYNNLPDPRFIDSPLGWAIAAFDFPPVAGLNGTITVNTTGILTSPNCANPVAVSVQSNANNNTVSVSTQSVDGCNVTVLLDPRVYTSQYGVINVPCPRNAANTSVSLQPVVFWFFGNRTNGTPEAQAVFCAPSIQVFNVQVFSMLTDGSLHKIDMIGGKIPPNNVTGGTLQGRAYNAVTFPFNTNPFIEARAIATGSSVAGAIFRAASQKAGGPLGLPNTFLDVTSSVYRLHLSLTAKSIYFVDNNSTLNAEMTSIVPVLWIDPLPAHLLATLLIMTGFIGIVVQILHQRERRKLLLATPPGSIAAIVSLTSRSGFGELLLPYDDEKTLGRKLSGLKFRLDRRTGAILADEAGIERTTSMGRDEAMVSLLGKGHSRDTTSISVSSDIAYQTAVGGYPPWRRPSDA